MRKQKVKKKIGWKKEKVTQDFIIYKQKGCRSLGKRKVGWQENLSSKRYRPEGSLLKVAEGHIQGPYKVYGARDIRSCDLASQNLFTHISNGGS
jgi:hypothetical protein